MPHVTFSSPILEHAITVYARENKGESILSLAEAHKIPLPRACRDGECGACEVHILTLSGKTIGSELTEKEKQQLARDGKITSEEIHLAEAKEIAPRSRLACQYRVGFEDVFVSFPAS